ncbi:MAG: hypothetical protein OEZ14_14895, partial [Acidimicrobiia bacterium]|nr:hypothetical protein [Acidimicrobiia bacterium]
MTEVRAHLDLVRLAGGSPMHSPSSSRSPVSVIEVSELSAQDLWKAEDLPIETRHQLMTAL